MNLEDIIEYCDGLPFLRKGEIKYHDEVAINILYELKTDQGCSICFYISGYIEYRVKKGSMNYWTSFEEFFEGLSPEGKENIIFHLNVFRSQFWISSEPRTISCLCSYSRVKCIFCLSSLQFKIRQQG